MLSLCSKFRRWSPTFSGAGVRRTPAARTFTLDGHLVGSIGEVVAAEALGLQLYSPSHAGHDAFDTNGDVQVKLTAGKKVAMYATCARAKLPRWASA